MPINPRQIKKSREKTAERDNTLCGLAERYNTTIDMYLRQRWSDGEEAVITFSELPNFRDGKSVDDLAEYVVKNYEKSGWKVSIDWKNRQFAFKAS